MVLEELGLEEDKLYKISKKEYLVNYPELNQEKVEIQDKRYDHYEKRRQEAIENARQIRNEIIKKESNTEEKNNQNKTSKYSSTGFNSRKNENMGEASDQAQRGMIKKELEKLQLMKKQQLGEIKNLIDYEYALNETRKKNELKKKKKAKKKKNYGRKNCEDKN